jgi:hypothetical protein
MKCQHVLSFRVSYAKSSLRPPLVFKVGIQNINFVCHGITASQNTIDMAIKAADLAKAKLPVPKLCRISEDPHTDGAGVACLLTHVRPCRPFRIPSQFRSPFRLFISVHVAFIIAVVVDCHTLCIACTYRPKHVFQKGDIVKGEERAVGDTGFKIFAAFDKQQPKGLGILIYPDGTQVMGIAFVPLHCP